jgi:hypothetical protein
MKEMTTQIKRKEKLKEREPKKEKDKLDEIGAIKLMIPREVQNANSLIFSQINLNKYSWEEDGEKVKFSFLWLYNLILIICFRF